MTVTAQKKPATKPSVARDSPTTKPTAPKSSSPGLPLFLRTRGELAPNGKATPEHDAEPGAEHDTTASSLPLFLGEAPLEEHVPAAPTTAEASTDRSFGGEDRDDSGADDSSEDVDPGETEAEDAAAASGAADGTAGAAGAGDGGAVQQKCSTCATGEPRLPMKEVVQHKCATCEGEPKTQAQQSWPAAAVQHKCSECDDGRVPANTVQMWDCTGYSQPTARRDPTPIELLVQTKCVSCDEPAGVQPKRSAQLDDDDRRPSMIHREAQRGLRGASQSLPHIDRIQAAFGRHDISSIRVQTGGEARVAATRMRALAFTSGERIAFREPPSVHLTAHEAAHAIQQRAGITLRDGVGIAGDRWERHADRVADAVVAGRSAESILDEVTGVAPVSTDAEEELGTTTDDTVSREPEARQTPADVATHGASSAAPTATASATIVQPRLTSGMSRLIEPEPAPVPAPSAGPSAEAAGSGEAESGDTEGGDVEGPSEGEGDDAETEAATDPQSSCEQAEGDDASADATAQEETNQPAPTPHVGSVEEGECYDADIPEEPEQEQERDPPSSDATPAEVESDNAVHFEAWEEPDDTCDCAAAEAAEQSATQAEGTGASAGGGQAAAPPSSTCDAGDTASTDASGSGPVDGEATGGGGGGGAGKARGGAPASDDESLARIAERESARDVAIAKYEESATSLGRMSLRAGRLPQGLHFKGTKRGSAPEEVSKAAKLEQVRAFAKRASKQMFGALRFAEEEVPARVSAMANLTILEIASAIEAEKANVTNRINQARDQVRASAAGAKIYVVATHIASVVRATMQTSAAIGKLTTEHATSTTAVSQGRETGLSDLNSLFGAYRILHNVAGELAADDAIDVGNARAGDYQDCKGDFSDDGLFTGCLTVRRAQAQQKAACKTAEATAKNMVTTAARQGQGLRDLRTQYRCAVISSAGESQTAIDSLREQLTTGLTSSLESTLAALNATLDANLAAIDHSLAASLQTLTEQEHEQRQAINDSGYMQQVAVEELAHTFAEGMVRGIDGALQRTETTVSRFLQHLTAGEPPEDAQLARAIASADQGLDKGLGALLGRMRTELASSEERILEAGTNAWESLGEITRGNEEAATKVEQSFTDEMSKTMASARQAMGKATDRQVCKAKEGETTGVAGMQNAVTGFDKAVTGIFGKALEALVTSLAKLNKDLGDQKDRMGLEITRNAWLAADKEQPAWVDVVAVILIIVVIALSIVASVLTAGLATGPLAILVGVLVGAVVGAISAGLIQIINNWRTGERDLMRGVGKAMLVGAIGGAIGGGFSGLGGVVAGAVIREGMRLGTRVALNLAINLTADMMAEAATQAVQIGFFGQKGFELTGFATAAFTSIISSARSTPRGRAAGDAIMPRSGWVPRADRAGLGSTLRGLRPRASDLALGAGGVLLVEGAAYVDARRHGRAYEFDVSRAASSFAGIGGASSAARHSAQSGGHETPTTRPTEGGGHETPTTRPTEGGGHETPATRPTDAAGQGAPTARPTDAGTPETAAPRPTDAGTPETAAPRPTDAGTPETAAPRPTEVADAGGGQPRAAPTESVGPTRPTDTESTTPRSHEPDAHPAQRHEAVEAAPRSSTDATSPTTRPSEPAQGSTPRSRDTEAVAVPHREDAPSRAKSADVDPEQRVKMTGADSTAAPQDPVAARKYDEIRASTDDVPAVAREMGVSEAAAQRIKDHLFVREHDIPTPSGPRRERFEPVGEYADAWKAAQQGTLTPDQRTLLRDLMTHENVEARVHAEGSPVYDPKLTFDPEGYPQHRFGDEGAHSKASLAERGFHDSGVSQLTPAQRSRLLRPMMEAALEIRGTFDAQTLAKMHPEARALYDQIQRERAGRGGDGGSSGGSTPVGGSGPVTPRPESGGPSPRPTDAPEARPRSGPNEPTGPTRQHDVEGAHTRPHDAGATPPRGRDTETGTPHPHADETSPTSRPHESSEGGTTGRRGDTETDASTHPSRPNDPDADLVTPGASRKVEVGEGSHTVAAKRTPDGDAVLTLCTACSRMSTRLEGMANSLPEGSAARARLEDLKTEVTTLENRIRSGEITEADVPTAVSELAGRLQGAANEFPSTVGKSLSDIDFDPATVRAREEARLARPGEFAVIEPVLGAPVPPLPKALEGAYRINSDGIISRKDASATGIRLTSVDGYVEIYKGRTTATPTVDAEYVRPGLSHAETVDLNRIRDTPRSKRSDADIARMEQLRSKAPAGDLNDVGASLRNPRPLTAAEGVELTRLRDTDARTPQETQRLRELESLQRRQEAADRLAIRNDASQPMGKRIEASERLGELGADQFVAQKFPEATKIYEGGGAGTVDRVYRNGNPPPQFIIVEAKGGSATNSSSRQVGGQQVQQGRRDYLESVLNDKSTRRTMDPQLREDLIQSLRNQELHYLEVTQKVTTAGNIGDIRARQYDIGRTTQPPSAGPLKNRSGNLDDASAARRNQPHTDTPGEAHARRQAEAARSGNEPAPTRPRDGSETARPTDAKGGSTGTSAPRPPETPAGGPPTRRGETEAATSPTDSRSPRPTETPDASSTTAARGEPTTTHPSERALTHPDDARAGLAAEGATAPVKVGNETHAVAAKQTTAGDTIIALCSKCRELATQLREVADGLPESHPARREAQKLAAEAERLQDRSNLPADHPEHLTREALTQKCNELAREVQTAAATHAELGRLTQPDPKVGPRPPSPDEPHAAPRDPADPSHGTTRPDVDRPPITAGGDVREGRSQSHPFEGHLKFVGETQGVVAQGKSRQTLTAEQHRELVTRKFERGALHEVPVLKDVTPVQAQKRLESISHETLQKLTGETAPRETPTRFLVGDRPVEIRPTKGSIEVIDPTTQRPLPVQIADKVRVQIGGESYALRRVVPHESDRIILFRVDDKPRISDLARGVFTVPGPVWTPASSVGFVAGAVHSNKLIVLATGVNPASLHGRSGPAIYAREIQFALANGYTIRAAKTGECLVYPGPRSRSTEPAAFVLEPPASPRRQFVSEESVLRLLDNQAKWKDFPLDLDGLIRRFPEPGKLHGGTLDDASAGRRTQPHMAPPSESHARRSAEGTRPHHEAPEAGHSAKSPTPDSPPARRATETPEAPPPVPKHDEPATRPSDQSLEHPNDPKRGLAAEDATAPVKLGDETHAVAAKQTTEGDTIITLCSKCRELAKQLRRIADGRETSNLARQDALQLARKAEALQKRANLHEDHPDHLTREALTEACNKLAGEVEAATRAHPTELEQLPRAHETDPADTKKRAQEPAESLGTSTEWGQFSRAHDQEFTTELREFRGNDVSAYKPSLRGGEGQLFGSSLRPDRMLKRWFAERVVDMPRSVELLRGAEAAVAASDAISALIHVVKVDKTGSDWILREFVSDSTPIRSLRTDPDMMAVREAVLNLGLHAHANEFLKLLGPKVKRYGSNVHWSPSLKKLVIIDMQ